MKKGELVNGIVYMLAGLLALCLALVTETRMEGLFWGLTGAALSVGAGIVARYLYWSTPKRREKYREKLENEQIEREDERNVMLRDRAGRYAYALGLVVNGLSLLVLCILSAVGILTNVRGIVLMLAAYLLFQVLSFILILSRLQKAD